MVRAASTEERLRRDRVEQRLRAFFGAAREDVAAAYLFGSVARAEARARSDVDVGVLYAAAPPRTLAGLPVELEAELTSELRAQVQILVLNDAPVDLVHRVLRDGILVCDRDRSRRIAFEVRSRNLYWDLQPVLRRYRRLEPRRSSGPEA